MLSVESVSEDSLMQVKRTAALLKGSTVEPECRLDPDVILDVLVFTRIQQSFIC